MNTLEARIAQLKKQVGTEPEFYEGTYRDEPVRFNRRVAGICLNDDELAALLDDAEIVIERLSKKNAIYSVLCRLGRQENGSVRPVLDFDATIIPISIRGYVLSPEERERLESGERVAVTGLISKAGKPFDTQLSFDQEHGIQMHFD